MTNKLLREFHKLTTQKRSDNSFCDILTLKPTITMAVVATGMVLSVAQTLLTAFKTKELKELCSNFKYESELRKLKDTVTTIKAVLMDAEFKPYNIKP